MRVSRRASADYHQPDPLGEGGGGGLSSNFATSMGSRVLRLHPATLEKPTEVAINHATVLEGTLTGSEIAGRFPSTVLTLPGRLPCFALTDPPCVEYVHERGVACLRTLGAASRIWIGGSPFRVSDVCDSRLDLDHDNSLRALEHPPIVVDAFASRISKALEAYPMNSSTRICPAQGSRRLQSLCPKIGVK